jgi:hypothetical protein
MKQLKDVFVAHMIAPKALKALERRIAGGEARKQKRFPPHQGRQ